MNGQYNVGDIVLGEWKLAKLLGQGSYGKVFEGEREDFGQIYKAAIKIITIPQSQSEVQSAYSEGLDDISVKTYFQTLVHEMVQEFGLMAKLKGNSNIVSYEDHRVIPHSEGIGWDIIIRMECLVPMLDYMGKRILKPKEVARIAIDMCKALELCAKFNIIHRDIKPENMFVSDLGDYKLGDFGIARTIEKSNSNMSKKGTYTYMAPEVYKEEPYNLTVDIYSLGIVLYRFLNNNRAPFLPVSGALTHGIREQALMQRISGAPLPPPCDAKGRLANAVLKACAYDPKDRWQTPTEMREEFEYLYYNMNEDGTMKNAASVPEPVNQDEDDDDYEMTVSSAALNSRFSRAAEHQVEQETTLNTARSISKPPETEPDNRQNIQKQIPEFTEENEQGKNDDLPFAVPPSKKKENIQTEPAAAVIREPITDKSPVYEPEKPVQKAPETSQFASPESDQTNIKDKQRKTAGNKKEELRPADNKKPVKLIIPIVAGAVVLIAVIITILFVRSSGTAEPETTPALTATPTTQAAVSATQSPSSAPTPAPKSTAAPVNTPQAKQTPVPTQQIPTNPSPVSTQQVQSTTTPVPVQQTQTPTTPVPNYIDDNWDDDNPIIG